MWSVVNVPVAGCVSCVIYPTYVADMQNNTCPMCRATMDPSIRTPDAEAQAGTQEDADRLLRLFRAVFGGDNESAGQPAEEQEDDREAFSSMYSW